MRTKKEIYIDYLLTLYLIRYSEENNYHIDGRLKFQKLMFISEINMLNKSEKGLHLKFFRYNYGPYSRELAEDYKELEKRDLITNFKITSAGIEILNLLWEGVKGINKNRSIANELEKTVNHYGKYNGYALKDIVYKMKIKPHDMPGQELRIRNIPLFVDLIVPENFKTNVKFDMPDDVLGIFEEELKLTPEARERIDKEWPAFLGKGYRKLLNVAS